MKKSSPIVSGLWRFLRVAVAVVIAGLIAKYSNDPYWIALAPFINGFFKWLRDAHSFDIKVL